MEGAPEQTTNWSKEMLAGGIMDNLSGMFGSVSQQVGEVAVGVGITPEALSPGAFSMIRNVSESITIPIVGLILTSIVCYEPIQIIIDHDNLNNLETWIFLKWTFKTFVAVVLITNTFNTTMAVFDIADHMIKASGDIIAGDTTIDPGTLDALEKMLMEMEVRPLLGPFLQSLIVQIMMSVSSIIIFIIAYRRMIETHLMTSLAPIPLSTFGNREQSQVRQNYLRSLFALGFQGFLIMICVGTYAILISELTLNDDIIMPIWGIMGYTVLLCFTLLKAGSLAKSVFNAH